MIETGQVDRIWKKWKKERRQDCNEQEAPSLGMQHVITAFVLLALAILVAVLVCGGENVLATWRRRREEDARQEEQQLFRRRCRRDGNEASGKANNDVVN